MDALASYRLFVASLLIIDDVASTTGFPCPPPCIVALGFRRGSRERVAMGILGPREDGCQGLVPGCLRNQTFRYGHTICAPHAFGTDPKGREAEPERHRHADGDATQRQALEHLGEQDRRRPASRDMRHAGLFLLPRSLSTDGAGSWVPGCQTRRCGTSL